MKEPGSIRNRKWDAGPRVGNWLGQGSLSPEQGADASRRLGLLGLLVAVIFSMFFVLFYTKNVEMLSRWRSPYLPVAGVSFAILASLTIFVLSHRKRLAPGLLLNIGLVYEVVIALTVGFMSHLGPWQLSTRLRGWSGVAVWIIVFAVIVHNTPVRTMLASLLAALMDPLGLGISILQGNPVPPAGMFPQMFVPTLVAVVVAVIAARINFRMGKDIQRARELGSYKLVKLLGQGGMGEVWRAEHKTLARPAAIKLIRPEALGEGGADAIVRRFEREAQATAMLTSHHTIRVHDFGVSRDGSFYYVMELLDGMDLEALVKSHGPLPPERVVYLMVQICDSLAEAHQVGLVHRDIKPANIYVCRRGVRYDQVKVLDFGLVTEIPGRLPGSDADSGGERLTVEGQISGTPAFMAPEAISAGEIDPRADIYALGCVVYWLLTGEGVFKRVSSVEVMAAHLYVDPEPLSKRSSHPIPAALDEIVLSCLAKNPGRRPHTAEQLAEKLRLINLEPTWDQECAREWWHSKVSDPVAIEPPSGTPTETASTLLDAEPTEVDARTKSD